MCHDAKSIVKHKQWTIQIEADIKRQLLQIVLLKKFRNQSHHISGLPLR